MSPAARGVEAVGEILADVSKDRLTAARKTLAWLDERASDPKDLMAAARRLVFNKGNDSHDYKFSSAVLEDFYHVTPAWRSRYLATSMFNFRGAGDRDNDLIKRVPGPWRETHEVRGGAAPRRVNTGVMRWWIVTA